jgi:hypothetical protein
VQPDISSFLGKSIVRMTNDDDDDNDVLIYIYTYMYIYNRSYLVLSLLGAQNG